MENRRPKLLLADHSPTIRKVVELTFADEGVDVTSVGDAQTAMQKFVEIQPDIVLADVSLSGTNGYQICEMIKADEATRHLPVLLLVGSFEPFDQAEAERVGADGFLTKPFHSTKDLVVSVYEMIGKKAKPGDANGRDMDDGSVKIDISEPAITEDIDDLYTSSFVQTAEIEEFETVEDLFGDSGLDDELIETTYPTDRVEDDFHAVEPDLDLEMKAFDWSPTEVVSPDEPLLETPVTGGFEPKFVFDDLDNDDRGFAAEREIDDKSSGESLSVNDDRDVGPVNQAPYQSAGADEPSPEFIALVAQRVVEKLSDKVIREIAQQAVPMITEKLIREALEEEGRR